MEAATAPGDDTPRAPVPDGAPYSGFHSQPRRYYDPLDVYTCTANIVVVGSEVLPATIRTTGRGTKPPAMNVEIFTTAL